MIVAFRASDTEIYKAVRSTFQNREGDDHYMILVLKLGIFFFGAVGEGGLYTTDEKLGHIATQYGPDDN